MSTDRDHGALADARAYGSPLVRGVACLLILLAYFFCGFAMAAAEHAYVLPVDEAWFIDDFATQIELLEDENGALGIDDLLAPEVAARFERATLASANIGFTSSAWWVRFTLRNEAATERQLFLRQTYPLIDYLKLFAPTPSGTWRTLATGDRLPFAARPIENRDFIFPLAVPAQSERTFYMRYASQGPVDISLSLYDTGSLLGSLSREQVAFGIYFGCVIMLLVWSGLVFIAVRDKAFLAYFAYVASFGLYMSVSNGLAYQFLWPDSPRWGNTSVIVLICVALIAALQFSRMILQSRRFAPRLDRVAQVMQLAATALLIAAPFARYAVLIAPVAMLILIGVIYMLTLGIVCMLSGSRAARLYVLAWGSFLCGSIVYLLKVFGFLPHTFFTQNGWQIGSLLEMILLSMSLSMRMNELQQQSRTDPLTMLGNRRLFNDRLQTELALAQQTHRPLSLLVLDIDHFKAYNDRHGHARGDEAIKRVADVLRKHVRKPHIACRHGGEEFTVILPGTDIEGAGVLAERLRRNVAEALSGELHMTISVGYACTTHSAFASAEALFDAADFALYSAKQQGRNRSMAFTERRAEQSQTASELAASGEA